MGRSRSRGDSSIIRLPIPFANRATHESSREPPHLSSRPLLDGAPTNHNGTKRPEERTSNALPRSHLCRHRRALFPFDVRADLGERADSFLAVSDPAAHPALLAPHFATTFSAAATGHEFSSTGVDLSTI